MSKKDFEKNTGSSDWDSISMDSTLENRESCVEIVPLFEGEQTFVAECQIRMDFLTGCFASLIFNNFLHICIRLAILVLHNVRA